MTFILLQFGFLKTNQTNETPEHSDLVRFSLHTHTHLGKHLLKNRAHLNTEISNDILVCLEMCLLSLCTALSRPARLAVQLRRPPEHQRRAPRTTTRAYGNPRCLTLVPMPKRTLLEQE